MSNVRIIQVIVKIFNNIPRRQGESIAVLNNILNHIGKEFGERFPYVHENYETYTFEEKARVLEEGFDEWASHIDNDGIYLLNDYLFKIQIAQKITCRICKRFHYRYSTNTFLTLVLPSIEETNISSYPLTSALADYFGNY